MLEQVLADRYRLREEKNSLSEGPSATGRRPFLFSWSLHAHMLSDRPVERGHRYGYTHFSMSEEDIKAAFRARITHHAEILNPIFDPTPYTRDVHRLFEFVCVLVRASGMEDAGWDSWYESQAILNDLQGLAKLDLPPDKFPEANRTRLRLVLLSYCHVTEMNLPYALLANLLRLRIGHKYTMDPFGDLARIAGKKRGGRLILPSPGKKIERIVELSKTANFAAVGCALETIYDSPVRNAVYHSDYALTDRELRLLAGTHYSRKEGVYTPVVELDELNTLVVETFAFYRALFALYERCRKSFGDFQNAFLPYDSHYKGVLQLIFDDESVLAGFRVYWPNESVSEYSRSKNGCTGMNLAFDPDGSINFMVGINASRPGAFSPLVEDGAQPTYAVIPGTNTRPHWPGDLKLYKLGQVEIQCKPSC